MDRVELNDLAETERSSWKDVRVHCCTASGCVAADSPERREITRGKPSPNASLATASRWSASAAWVCAGAARSSRRPPPATSTRR